MSYPLIEAINSPKDLKQLDKKSIPLLCDEIRRFLIENVEKTGGHLASNLGAVELTLAIHRVFDSPKDHIIFDVGHQSYVHKLITGRREGFESLRSPGGLSGFTSRKESEHDSFGAGHSSTSISASLGFAEADSLMGSDAYTVCVTGDGAYTGGMVHEALNNSRPNLPLVIILNENGMSISSNKGTFASYLSKVRVSGKYRKWKAATTNILLHIPFIGKPIKKFFTYAKKKIKRLIFSTNYFEELGLYYIGPIDGNNYDKVEKALRQAKSLGMTAVVHLKTKKGKGYPPAEQSPDDYHSVSSSDHTATYHNVFANELISLAKEDEKIVAVTAAMGIGTGLSLFDRQFPNRYFDVGIAEAHALTFSAGLAANGLKPFAAIYSTFLQRGYDNILHDIALQGLPVKIMIDRAGLAVSDGATHHGIFDVAFLSHIPNMTILAPATYDSLKEAIRYAQNLDSPIAIRYPNAGECQGVFDSFKTVSASFEGRVLVDFDTENPPKHIFITYGKIVERVMEAVRLLREEEVAAGIILVETLKPYDEVARTVCGLILNAERVVYVEEGIKNGAAAELTREALIDIKFDFSKTEYLISAIEDNFALPETVCDLYDFAGFSPQKLKEKMKEK